jgi:hypothetical protein
MLHVFVRIWQNESGTNNRRCPNEIGVLHLHSMDAVIKVDWCKSGLKMIFIELT